MFVRWFASRIASQTISWIDNRHKGVIDSKQEMMMYPELQVKNYVCIANAVSSYMHSGDDADTTTPLFHRLPVCGCSFHFQTCGEGALNYNTGAPAGE